MEIGISKVTFNPTHPHPRPISRSACAFQGVEEAIEFDRRWFAEHPSEDEYIREFCPGEFGAEELPEIPGGWRYATIVTVIHRSDGVADGRYRALITLCDDLNGAVGCSR